MQPAEFVAIRRERWERLEALVAIAAKDPRHLTGTQILELGRLYRAVTSDLAIARRDFPQDRVTTYLNALVARAHPAVYRRPPVDAAAAWRFFRYGFPTAYRSAGRYTLAAFLIFAVAALVSAALVAYRPSTADILLPGTAQSLRTVMEQHHLWMQSATSNHSVAANFIMLNNIEVAFLAFAGGLLAGLGTVLVMVVNGIEIGAVGTMVAQYHLSLPFWTFVIPHGIIELSVVFMAGGAGLMMGDAILRPGLRRRRDAVAQAGSVAIRLVFGAVPLLIIAGTIEGFFSASSAPGMLKLGVGLVSGVLLYSYWLFSRAPDSRPLPALTGASNVPPLEQGATMDRYTGQTVG
ncbi:MAG TPA: stage II sporulation protein M [Chloroflexota bacterium]|nr:stage II sporulation protein M [Chloroflexota bacterium]